MVPTECFRLMFCGVVMLVVSASRAHAQDDWQVSLRHPEGGGEAFFACQTMHQKLVCRPAKAGVVVILSAAMPFNTRGTIELFSASWTGGISDKPLVSWRVHLLGTVRDVIEVSWSEARSARQLQGRYVLRLYIDTLGAGKTTEQFCIISTRSGQGNSTVQEGGLCGS